MVMLSSDEAEVHYRPSLLSRVLLGRRHAYSPIVRVPATVLCGEALKWVHKHTGRVVDEELLELLERLPPQSDVRQALLAAAMEEP